MGLRASLLLVVGFLIATGATAADLPPGFSGTLLSNDLFRPTAMDFGPNGEIWITGKHGQLWIYRGGSLIRAGRISVDLEGERGIGGIALDPDYATNGHVWLYYTVPAPRPHNRLSRFKNAGDRLADETVMVDGPPLQSPYHNGGCIRFAPDKTLFLTLGDDEQESVAQDTHDLRGKVLHLDRNGRPAPDNPFLDGIGGDPRVWAYGFRNPWRFSVQPGTGNLFIGDVGGDFWEEIDLGVRGGNFGWPLIEGPQPPGQPGYIYPLYSYPHDPLLGSAVIGGDHARAGSFAPEYEGNYFFADHTSGRLFRMRLDANNTPLSTEAWATGLNLPTEVRFGPDGSLYYLAFNAGEIWRIAYVGGSNRQPTATGTVTPDNGGAPLTVTFDASASRDADGDALSYRWSFGDGQASAQPQVSHTYPPGSYTATLSVMDGVGSSTAPPFRIVSGNRRPTVQITSPPNESPYHPGQTIVFSGVANDPEEGALGCERFAWKVIVHHLEHTHPFLGPTQGACQGTFVVPAEVSGHRTTDKDIHLEIDLSVDDTGAPLGASGILAGTAAILIRPPANSANR